MIKKVKNSNKLKQYKSIGFLITKGKKDYIHNYTCKNCKQKKSSIKRNKTIYISKLCKSCCNKKRWNKKICLRYYKNQESETAQSITEFCLRHPELDKNAKYHFAEVLGGKRLHYKGWLRADNKIKINVNKVISAKQVIMNKAIIK